MTRVINGWDELRSLVGQEAGVSEWLPVTQAMIDQFADPPERLVRKPGGGGELAQLALDPEQFGPVGLAALLQEVGEDEPGQSVTGFGEDGAEERFAVEHRAGRGQRGRPYSTTARPAGGG